MVVVVGLAAGGCHYKEKENMKGGLSTSTESYLLLALSRVCMCVRVCVYFTVLCRSVQGQLLF